MIPGIIAAGGVSAQPPIASPLTWWRFNKGITEAGTGVSQWDDASGNAYHLTQATDAKRPDKSGDGSILFNGTSDWLSNTALNQAGPITIYALMRQVTWTLGRYFWNNNNSTPFQLAQNGSGGTPRISLSGGADIATNANLTLNTYLPLGVVYNGASSVIHVNGSAATTGDTGGATTLSTFTLGCLGFDLFFANIQTKELLIYAAAHDGTQRQTVFDYLAAL